MCVRHGRAFPEEQDTWGARNRYRSVTSLLVKSCSVFYSYTNVETILCFVLPGAVA